MPLLPIIALFAAGLALAAAGLALGMILLVLGAILLSLKLGMPVVRSRPQTREAPVRGGLGRDDWRRA